MIRRVRPIALLIPLLLAAPYLAAPPFCDGGQRGNIIFSDESYRVRKLTTDGKVTTVAGNGTRRYSGDHGPAWFAQIAQPRGVALDAAGNLYIADFLNGVVRKVDAATNVITTVAGRGVFGYSGDGGPATAASIGWPVDVAFDGAGNMLIADRYFSVVRKVDRATNRISTIMGTGAFGYSGDGGPARAARMALPGGMAVDGAGNIYVAESANHIVRRMDASTGIVRTIAGVAPPTGILGDGELATLASLNSPRDLAFDAAGNLFIADEGNNRIRKVSAAPVPPVLAVAPSSVSFQATFGGAAPSAQQLHILNTNFANLQWSAQVLGNAAEWVSVSPASGAAPSLLTVSADPGNRLPGAYSATILINAPGAVSSPQTVSVRINVAAEAQPTVAISTQLLEFQGIAGGINPTPQVLLISNAGSGSLAWSAAAQTTTGGDWLAVSAVEGSAPSTIFVSANPRGLAPGVYRGRIHVANQGGGPSASTVVHLTVASPASSILLSNTGFQFTAVEGGAALPAKQFSVLNGGEGILDWSLVTSTTSGGSWLQVTPSGGSSDAGAVASSPKVSVSPNVSGLRAGTYSGLITVTAPGAVNSPQVLSVALVVLPAGSSPPPEADHSKLLFVVREGSAGTSVQSVSLFSPGPPLSFSAAVAKEGGPNWLSVSPDSGRILGEGSLSIQVNPEGLTPAAYRGTITLSFSNGAVFDIAVLTIVSPLSAGLAAGGRAADGCTPTDQYLLPTSIGNNRNLAVGYPAVVLIQVADNCGSAVTGANVFVTFDSGDPTLFLNDLRTGIYSATWTPQNATVGTKMRFSSVHPQLKSSALEYEVGLQQARAPQVFRGGVVNGASFEPRAPLAPGSIISAFGQNLTPQTYFSPTLPLATNLGGLSMKIGAYDVPLFFSSTGQVNAQVPFELPPNATFSVLTSLNGALATPEPITVSASQPGIFTRDQSGSGPGAILNQDFSENSVSRPAARGSVIQVFATGLGATNPRAPSGRPSPGSPPATTVSPVQARIGGLPAAVQFAGLAPGFVGLYQVNVTVPEGVPAGPNISLELIQNGASSNTVTIAVQ